MENVVGVLRGSDKISSFKDLINLTLFDTHILESFNNSGKEKENFKIVIKPNIMVFINPNCLDTVTDRELVEYLIDHIIGLGFSDMSICEAQNDVGQMLKNHNVKFISEKIGYKPAGRYKIVDLSNESVTHQYKYQSSKGETKYWKDKVGVTWRDADFRITFAKCKTHEHDWMTLGVKNIYGCFPPPKKVTRYHIKNEVFDVTARSLANFPVHFSFVDAWVGSDGFQGYKICNPKELKMLFGGKDCIAVDMEIFKRAGLKYTQSHILKKAIEQMSNGTYPEYTVKGDTETEFSSICEWENIPDSTIKKIDFLEEIYILWGFINMKVVAKNLDLVMFPPKNIIFRFMVWFTKMLYRFFKIFSWYRRLYQRKK